MTEEQLIAVVVVGIVFVLFILPIAFCTEYNDSVERIKNKKIKEKNEMERSNLGKRMIRYRAKHRITQRELATRLGLSIYVVTSCETGRHAPHKANEVMIEEKMDMLERE